MSFMYSVCFLLSGPKMPSARSSEELITAFKGVLNSCEKFAKKSFWFLADLYALFVS